MTPKQREAASEELTRAIGQLSKWQQHLRNPAKKARPTTSLAATLTRLERWQPILDAAALDA
jgi:hypothetical protein